MTLSKPRPILLEEVELVSIGQETDLVWCGWNVPEAPWGIMPQALWDKRQAAMSRILGQVFAVAERGDG